MLKTILLIARALALACRGHQELVFGNIALRQQLKTLRRTVWHPRLQRRAPRIHGELRKLWLEVSERAVSLLLPRQRRRPSQTWRTFLTKSRGRPWCRWISSPSRRLSNAKTHPSSIVLALGLEPRAESARPSRTRGGRHALRRRSVADRLSLGVIPFNLNGLRGNSKEPPYGRASGCFSPLAKTGANRGTKEATSPGWSDVVSVTC